MWNISLVFWENLVFWYLLTFKNDYLFISYIFVQMGNYAETILPTPQLLLFFPNCFFRSMGSCCLWTLDSWSSIRQHRYEITQKIEIYHPNIFIRFFLKILPISTLQCSSSSVLQKIDTSSLTPIIRQIFKSLTNFWFAVFLKSIDDWQYWTKY